MAEIIIAKHRNGALGEVKLRFIDYLAKLKTLILNRMIHFYKIIYQLIQVLTGVDRT